MPITPFQAFRLDKAEYEVLRGAFLVERSDVEKFDAEAEKLARRHSAIRFKLTGPLPPHHFVSEQWAS